jgi:hypothetical protein
VKAGVKETSPLGREVKEIKSQIDRIEPARVLARIGLAQLDRISRINRAILDIASTDARLSGWSRS